MREENQTDLVAALTLLVDRLERYQTQTRLSDKAFCGRHRAHIGSPKTWRDRLLPRKFKDLSLPKWIARLNELCAILDGGSQVKAYYPELPFAKKYEARLALLEGQTNDRRCLVILAPTGIGKSVVTRQMVEADRKSRAYARALPTWREKDARICQGIASALNCGSQARTAGAADNLDSIIAVLRATPLTVFIDEAHEGGVALMAILKVLIDSTSSRFVYLAYPTDFDRVRSATTGAIVEAQQFLGRCLKPIFDNYRDGLLVEDVTAYLQAAAGFNGDARAIADQILPILRGHYNLRLLDDAIAEARFKADEENCELDGALIVKSIEELVGKLTPDNKKDAETRRHGDAEKH